MFPGLLVVGIGVALTPHALPAQTAGETQAAELPDAPRPQAEVVVVLSQPQAAGESMAGPQQLASPSSGDSLQGDPQRRETRPGFPPVSPEPVQQPSRSPRQNPGIPSEPAGCQQNLSTPTVTQMSCAPKTNPFQRFVDSGPVHPLTPKQKGMLALRNTLNPFNFATIALNSAVSTAADPRSPYGPGVPGFGRNIGVAYTETAVDEFFGTFLIPSLAHQDPHYHRMPNASIQRRVLHAITEVAVGQSDYGTPMVNYATLLTTGIGDALGDAYVPGREQGWGAGAQRYAIAIATDPIGNFITEFLPDVARRVNVHIVLVQRVINRVAVRDTP